MYVNIAMCMCIHKCVQYVCQGRRKGSGHSGHGRCTFLKDLRFLFYFNEYSIFLCSI